MSIRKTLGVTKPAQLDRRVLGRYIVLSNGSGASVCVSLKAWNRTGLDTKVD